MAKERRKKYVWYLSCSSLTHNDDHLKMLGALDLRGQARVDTKIFPLHPGDFKSPKVKETVKKSLINLGPNKIRVFYLHNPDRATPFEETLEAINDLHKQGILYVIPTLMIILCREVHDLS